MRMKIFLLFLLLVPSSYAKFASWVRNIPCEKAMVKVNKCKVARFKNQDLRGVGGKSRGQTMVVEGVIIQGQVLSQKAIKCHKNQSLDMKHYRKAIISEDKDIFVKDGSCDKTNIEFRVPQLFCDTPGAVEIHSCFIKALERKKGLIYGESL